MQRYEILIKEQKKTRMFWVKNKYYSIKKMGDPQGIAHLIGLPDNLLALANIDAMFQSLFVHTTTVEVVIVGVERGL